MAELYITQTRFRCVNLPEGTTHWIPIDDIDDNPKFYQLKIVNDDKNWYAFDYKTNTWLYLGTNKPCYVEELPENLQVEI